uniref:Transposase Tc1-like domain-containing protein n=1 Tax=Pygocentrus nattereri TaxID=42514 RepID=A0AAR2J834_PYGNA
GSPLCEQLHEQIVQQVKNNVSQSAIAGNLGISSSTVHNIIKRFRESGEISASKRQGRKPTLNARDLRSLRRHCIKNRHHSVKDIPTWAQEHFRKPLSVNTVRRSIYKCKLKLCHAKRKPHINNTQKRRRLLWAGAHLRWTDAKWKSVLWSDESTFQIGFGNHGRCVLRAKEEKDCLDYQRKVQKPASLMVWGCVSAHGMGNLHICEGTINAERYIQVLEQHMLPSKQRLFQGHPAYFSKTMPSHILHMLQQRGFIVKECGY